MNKCGEQCSIQVWPGTLGYIWKPQKWENDTFILYADQETHVNVYWNPLNLSIPTWDFKLDKLHQIMRESSEIA